MRWILPIMIFLPGVVASQPSLKIMTEAPVQYAIGWEGKLGKRFSTTLQIGVMTEPYSTLIVNLLEDFGTDPQITLMIDDAFKFGVVGELGVNYNFHKNYVGAFLQVIDLRAGDTPVSLVENYFGESISSYPSKRGQTQTTERELKLTSTLTQAGLLYGRRFPLRNKRLEIDAEFGISANIGSRSKLSSETRDLSALSEVVSEELSYYYSNYAFIPSLTVALAYKLGGRD